VAFLVWLLMLSFGSLAEASPLGPGVGWRRAGDLDRAEAAPTDPTPWPGVTGGVGAPMPKSLEALPSALPESLTPGYFVASPPAGSSEAEEDEEDGEIAQPDAPKNRRELQAPAPQRAQLLDKKNVPPFWLRREYDTHTTSALYLPPLYVHRKPKAGHDDRFFHADLALTFGWYSKTRLKKRVINPAVLFFGGFSEQRTSWGAVPLLMGYKRVGEQFRFGQFPLVWWWGSRYTKNFFVVPFHYQQRTPESFRGISALLFWYGKENLQDADPSNDRKYFVGAPLYYSFTRGPRRFDFGLLYVGGRNRAKGVKHRTIWPFVHWSSHEFGNRKELWTLGYVRRSDDARRKKAWAIPPLLTFRAHDGERTLLSATPLYWRATNSLRQSVTNIFGPVGTYTDHRQSAQWVAPLFLRFEDTRRDASASAALPFYFARRRGNELAVHTLVGFGRSGRGDRDVGWGFGVHPLLTYAGRRPDGRRHTFVAGGAFWRFKNPNARGVDGRSLAAEGGASAWGIGPMFYAARRGLDRHYGVPAVFAAGRRNGARYQMITPLVWHARDVEARRDTWVVGPGYYHRRQDDWQAGVAPLYFGRGGPKQRWHIAPLLLSGHVADREAGWARTFTPVFVRGTGSRGTLTSAGLLYWDVKRGAAPEAERHTVLAPLYYRRAVGSKTMHLTPLGGATRTPEGLTVGALLGYGMNRTDRRGFGVVPLVFHDRVLTGDDPGPTTVVAPLWARRRRPSGNLDMWSPLVWRTSYGGELPRKNLLILPVYGRQRQPGGVDIDAGLPWFYSRNATRNTHTLIAGPFFHRLSRSELHTGLAPISWWMDTEEKRRLLTFPLIWHFETKKTGERTTVAFPLWFDRIQPNGRRFWFAFPFVFNSKGQFNYTRAGIAAPGYVDIFRLTRRSARPGAPSSFRFRGWVPFYYRYDACGFREDDDPKCRYTVRGSFPFFLYGKDGQGRTTHAVSVLYYHDKTPAGRKVYTLLGGFANEPGKRFMAYGGPFAIDTTNEWRTVTLLPLFWDKRNRIPDKDISTTWVLPPLYIGQHKEDRRWFQSSLLFWQFRTPVKVTTTVAPPVFFLHQAYKERNLHWLLPLYVRDNRFDKDITWTWVFPGLYGAKRKGENSTAIQFPFLWHFERGQKRTTIGFPLWYDVRRNGNKTQVVPALYAGRHTAEQRTHVIGPYLGSWTRNQPDAPKAFHWRALFGIAGGGHQGGQRYGQVFWVKFKIGGAAKTPSEASVRREARREAREDRREARVRDRERRQTARREAREDRREARRAAHDDEKTASKTYVHDAVSVTEPPAR